MTLIKYSMPLFYGYGSYYYFYFNYLKHNKNIFYYI